MKTKAFFSHTTSLQLSAAIIFSMLLFGPLQTIAADVQLNVDFNDEISNLDMFWNGSGLNRQTSDYNSKVMRQNMLLIGSIPHQGSLYQRPHDLLELVKVSDLESGNPQYDWSKLDDFIHIIVKSGQKLFFELMGNPQGFDFGNFSKPFQQEAWRLFIRDLVLHLECKDANPDLDQCLGEKEVRSWYFQTWNETYKKWGANNFNRFKAYYDASWAGISDADPELRFGGPAVRQLNTDADNKIAWINKLIHSGSKLDYISYHHKKNGRTVNEWIADEIELLEKIDLPALPSSDNPFTVFNEEVDSESGWWENLSHRATPWYAAFIARQVHGYQTEMINGKDLKFRLANDNAFLRVPDKNNLPIKNPDELNSYTPSVGAWMQRTHFSHFGDDDNGFALIKKPAHNVMTLLSLLGDKQYAVSPENSNGVGIIATKRDQDQVAILLYHYHEEFKAPPGSKGIQLNLNNLPFSEGKLVHYRLDQDHSNTYENWRGMGEPEVPTDKQIQGLRNLQELQRLEPVSDLTSNNVTLDFDLPSPGVSLILISKKPARRPAPVTGLYAETFRSIEGKKDEVLLRWDSNSRFIQNYKVFYSDSAQGPFKKVNRNSQIDTAYIHQLESLPLGGGYYKVAALDYWGRTGKASVVLHVPKAAPPPPGIKIDFGAIGQSVQSNWREWSASGNDMTYSKAFSADFDNAFTIKLTNVDWRIRKPVDSSVKLADLIEDAVKNSSVFSVTFKGLNPGTYDITTYHHDSNEADGTLDIDVQDADGRRKAVVDNLPQSGGTNPSNIASATFRFRSDGRDVVLRVKDNNDGGKNEAFLNGIMLQ